jgi:hypothetical protein
MTDMRQYLAWVKQQQQNNPAWRDANVWQNRNQTAIKKQEKTSPDALPEGTEIVEEKPEE